MTSSWFNISLTSDKFSFSASEVHHSQEGKEKFCLIMQRENSHLVSINAFFRRNWQII